jgi:predicted nuclease with RNAse H fold
MSPAVVACGIDVSARPAGQQLCALERDGAHLRATFHPPASVARTVAAVLALGDVAVAIDAPSARRRDLLAAGAPLRAGLALPEGRYERSRVCDALLIRRGLPLYPVPPAGRPLERWERWMEPGFALFAALAPLGLYRPPPQPAAEAPAGPGALRHGRLCETYPDAVFCALLGERPPSKRTPEGAAVRRAVLRAAGVAGVLEGRTHDELDACAAALTALALAEGGAGWLGHPDEGVLVLPVARLAGRYVRRAR